MRWLKEITNQLAETLKERKKKRKKETTKKIDTFFARLTHEDRVDRYVNWLLTLIRVRLDCFTRSGRS
jgi:hypothetical protein